MNKLRENEGKIAQFEALCLGYNMKLVEKQRDTSPSKWRAKAT